METDYEVEGRDADHPGDGPCEIRVRAPVGQHREQRLPEKCKCQRQYGIDSGDGEDALKDERTGGFSAVCQFRGEGEEGREQWNGQISSDIGESGNQVVGCRIDIGKTLTKDHAFDNEAEIGGEAPGNRSGEMVGESFEDLLAPIGLRGNAQLLPKGDDRSDYARQGGRALTDKIARQGAEGH